VFSGECRTEARVAAKSIAFPVSNMNNWVMQPERALVSAIESGIDADPAKWQRAQLTEAFGQHFLTDSFSAGHVRTPRQAIVTWYQSDFAPRVMAPFLAHARERVSRILADQLNSQLVAPLALIEAAFNQALAGVLAYFEAEIRTRFQPLFGLGISGAISGTLHDTDNQRGIWVRSEAHPAPWKAYGDSRLECSPTSRDQAEQAVITAREQLVEAQAMGKNRREQRGTPAPAPGSTSPSGVPGVVHFAFDSSALDSASTGALKQAANFLAARPELRVDIVGHACPIGTDGYNDGLAACGRSEFFQAAA
jgi:hypothetical protein